MKAPMLVLMMAVATAACGPSQQAGNLRVKTNASVISSMSGHKTYAYDAVAPAPEGTAQWTGAETTLAEIKQQIDAHMQQKGYTLSETPDLRIRISLGVRTVRHDPQGMKAVQGAPSDMDTQQEMVIDVFDHANGGHLFHGTASNPLHHDEPSDHRLAKAVRLILEPVPSSG